MTNLDPAPIWIGTYDGGGGEGVYPLDRTTPERWTIGEPYRDAPNASFGTYSPRFDLHYLVDERAEGAIGVYRRDSVGWVQLAQVAAGGAAPCHIALDRTETNIAVANYASGSIALHRLDPTTGLPVAAPVLHTNTGHGPNTDRQQSPHAHWVGFSLDNRWLYATDLGTDAVLAFAFDADRGTLGAPMIACAAPPGSGPRHLLIHPRRPRSAYLACELTNTLVALEVDGATLRHRTTISTLPADWHGESIVAHIAVDAAGDRLYISNRGHDSIAVFTLDAKGDPTLLQHVASGGASPRFFLLLEDERQMIVAHERDHRVTALAIMPDGALAPTGIAVHVPGAAFAFAAGPHSPAA
jgi:6-phosphogluconolactonase (cycloisomerase 2 family)